MGNGISMILGTPGGRQFRIGSSESGVARGPYPGFALVYFSSAQGMKGGSSGLNAVVFWRSIQTPVKSRGENPACALWMLRIGAACANADIANTTAAIKVRLVRIHQPRSFALGCPSKIQVTTSPQNTRIWRLS